MCKETSNKKKEMEIDITLKNRHTGLYHKYPPNERYRLNEYK